MLFFYKFLSFGFITGHCEIRSLTRIWNRSQPDYCRETVEHVLCNCLALSILNLRTLGIHTQLMIQSSIWIMDLVSHTIYVVFVNFLHWLAGWKSIPNDAIFRGNFYFTLRDVARNVLRGCRLRHIFFIFRFD